MRADHREQSRILESQQTRGRRSWPLIPTIPSDINPSHRPCLSCLVYTIHFSTSQRADCSTVRDVEDYYYSSYSTLRLSLHTTYHYSSKILHKPSHQHHGCRRTPCPAVHSRRGDPRPRRPCAKGLSRAQDPRCRVPTRPAAQALLGVSTSMTRPSQQTECCVVLRSSR